MSMNQYWKGLVTRVNLTTGEVKREQLDPQILRDYIGGSGVGLKLLYDEVDPKTEPLSSENKLYFCCGPFNGLRVPGSGTLSIVTKGAQTGGIASAQTNGFFAARLRQAGHDFLILEGEAPEWSYIFIEDDKVEIRPASDLMGLSVSKTQKAVKRIAKNKKTSVACIGPAGENGISFAAICNDEGHVASTNGCGAVMGSKKIKAIGVLATKSIIEVPDEEALKEHFWIMEKGASQTGVGGAIKAFGTYAYFNGMIPTGQVPIKNYSTNVFEGCDMNQFYGQNFYAAVERKKRPCWGCPWGHCSEVKFKEGAKAGVYMEEIEFEMMAAFSTNIGQSDMSLATWLSGQMEENGVDGKENAYCISLVYELFSKGFLTKEDTGGLSFNWGETEDLPTLLNQIANRRGFGAIFSDGVRKASEKLGGKAIDMAIWAGTGYAPHVIDTRGLGGWSQNLSLAVSDNGSFYGTHHKNEYFKIREECSPVDPVAVGKATRHGSVSWVAMDNLGSCMFFTANNNQATMRAIELTTGWKLADDELYNNGDRTRAISRAYNILAGRKRSDDTASARMFMSQHDGPGAGHDLTGSTETMITTYLEASEYDLETGKPLPKLLNQLRLDDVANDLWK